MFIETFLLRFQESGVPFTQLRITRRRLWKGAHWGATIVGLNVSTTANTSPLHFMTSKHNILPTMESKETADVGHVVRAPMCSERHGSWLQSWGCKLYSSASSRAGLWMASKECFVSWFFRDDGTCLLLKEVAKRKEGYVYVIECEYSSFSGGLSSPNHGTCSVR